MSVSVDQRVVSMQFDNAQFEKGVQETLNSLNTLNTTIEKSTSIKTSAFTNLSNGLTKIGNLLTDNITPSIETVKTKFSILGLFSDQMIRNLSGSVTNTLNKIASSFFQVDDGLNEYHEKIESVQTIMMSTGASIDQVSKSLDELNTYSDKTIYSFRDMTSNIGKFTNQGIDLQTSVNAMKGIANEAALAGANAQQASHAMYNFAQALSSGYVKLIDWKSIEVANMSNVKFRQTLLDTAAALGTVVKSGDDYISTTTNMQGSVSDAFNAQKGFNDSLSHAWLTNNVLTQALEIYATDVRELSEAEKEEYETKLKTAGFTDQQIKDFEELGKQAANAATQVKSLPQLMGTLKEAIGSGWAKSFEIIVGNFEEAKALFTGLNIILSPLIDRFSDLRNENLQLWKDLGGRTALLQTIVNSINTIGNIAKPIGDAFEDVFGRFDGTAFATISKNIAEFTSKLVATDDEMAKIYSIAYKVASVMKTLLNLLWDFKKPIASLLMLHSSLKTLQVLLTGGLGLNTVYTLLKLIISIGIAGKLTNINGLIRKFSTLLTNVSKTARVFFTNLLSNLESVIKRIQSSGLYKLISSALQEISTLISKLFETLKTNLSFLNNFKFDGVSSVLKLIAELINVIIKGATNLIISINNLGKAFNPLNQISKIFNGTNESVKKTNNTIQKTSGLFTMVAYAAEQAEKPVYDVATGSIIMKDSVESLGDASEQASSQMGGFSGALAEYVNSLRETYPIVNTLIDFIKTIKWNKLIPLGIILLYLSYMKKIKKSVNSVGTAISNLCELSGKSLSAMFTTISGTFSAISGYFNSLTKINNVKNFKNTAVGIGLIAASIAALAVAFNYLDPAAIDRAMISVAGAAVAITLITTILVNMSKSVNMGGLAAISASILALGVVLAELTVIFIGVSAAIAILNVRFGSFKKALLAFGAILVSVMGVVGTGVATILLLAGALTILSGLSAPISNGAVAMLKMSAALLVFSVSLMSVITAALLIKAIVTSFVALIGGVVDSIVGFLSSLRDSESIAAELANAGIMILKIVTVIAAAVGIVLVISKTMQLMSNATQEFAISILAVALSISILATAIKKFGSFTGDVFQTTQLLSYSVGALVTTGVLIGVVVSLFSGVGSELKKVGSAFISFAASVAILYLAIKKIGQLEVGQVAKGILGVTAALAGLTVALRVLKGVGIGKIAAGILSLVVAMYLLTPLFALYAIAWKPMVSGILLVSGALLALGKSVSYMKGVNGADVLSISLTMVGVATALTYVYTILSGLSPTEAITALVSFTAMFAAFGLLAKYLGDISKEIGQTKKSLLSFVAVIGIMGAVVAGLTYVITQLAQLPWQNVLSAAGGLSLAMISFAASIGIIAKLSQSLTAANLPAIIGIILTFSAAVGVLSAAIWLLNGVPFETFAGMSLVIVALGVALAGVTAVIGMFSAALIAAVPFLTVFAGVLATLSLAFIGFGVAAVGVGAAITLIQLGFAALLLVLQSFIPTLEEFIQFIADISGKSAGIIEMSSALEKLGTSLVKLGAGMAVVDLAGIGLAAALALVGAASTVFANGLVVAGAAIESFAQSVAIAVATISGLSDQASEWGSHLVQNLANGINGQSGTVVSAVLNVAKTIWSYLHQSDAECGPLKGVWQWGAHLVQNIGSGIIQGIPGISAIATTLGLTEKAGFENGSAGTGSSVISNIVSELFSGIGSISSAGASAGSAYMQAFLNQIRGVGGYNTAAVAKGRAKRTGKFANLTFDRDEAPINGYHGKATNGSLSIDSFLPSSLVSNENAATTATDALANAFDNLGASAGGATGGSGGGSGGGGGGTSGASQSASENATAQEEAAKAARTHAKYLDYLGKTATQYTNISNKANASIGDTSGYEASKTAIEELAQSMYEASLTGEETEEELAKKQQKIEEVFVETYENIQEKIKSSLDLMEAFDLQLSNTTKSTEVLKNMQSQYLGTLELVSRQQLLAERGLNSDYLQELIEKGSEGLPEINSLLRMSTEEIQQFNKGLDGRKALADWTAQNGLAAIATAKMNQKLRETVKTQDTQISKAKEISYTYTDISQKLTNETGLIAELMTNALTSLSQQFEQIATDMGISSDQLTQYVNGTALTVEQASLKQIDNYNKVKEAFIEYSDTVNTETNRIKSALSSLSTSFDELELLSEDDEDFTITDMQDNIESQVDGMQKWAGELTDLASRIDNTELISQLADLGTDGYKYVHALYEASDDELDEFVSTFSEKLATIDSVSQTYGNQIGLNLVSGIDSSLVTYFQELQNGSDQTFQTLTGLMNKKFETIGQDSSSGMTTGIQLSQEALVSAATTAANDMETAVSEVVNADTGFAKTSDYMLGMLNGLQTYKRQVLDEIDDITSAMEDATAEGLDVHSPSKFTKWVGKNLILGFIKGMEGDRGSLLNSVDSIVDNMRSAINGAYDILTTDGNMNPTITPVLNLKDLKNGSRTIGNMFNSNGFSIGANLGVIHTPTDNTSKLNEMLEGMSAAQNNKSGNSYNFVQNNYSPKALSRLDIYRQTKNQFAQMKGMVNSNG